MFRLIYMSRAIKPQNAAALVELLTVACRNNSRDGITGLLCYGAPYFFQCLEGSTAAVNRTMAKIVRDTRHTDIVIVDARAVLEREFAEWRMKLIQPNQHSPDLFSSMHEESLSGSELNRADRLLTIMNRMAIWSLPYSSEPEFSALNFQSVTTKLEPFT